MFSTVRTAIAYCFVCLRYEFQNLLGQGRDVCAINDYDSVWSLLSLLPVRSSDRNRGVHDKIRDGERHKVEFI